MLNYTKGDWRVANTQGSGAEVCYSQAVCLGG